MRVGCSEMYWSAWAKGGAAGAGGGLLMRARMDGSRARALLDADLHWPNGLALHEGVLYW